nr:MAG TPA: FeoB-associated Cys-rich membrane protein [Caudoviricetes sp.]
MNRASYIYNRPHRNIITIIISIKIIMYFICSIYKFFWSKRLNFF